MPIPALLPAALGISELSGIALFLSEANKALDNALNKTGKSLDKIQRTLDLNFKEISKKLEISSPDQLISKANNNKFSIEARNNLQEKLESRASYLEGRLKALNRVKAKGSYVNNAIEESSKELETINLHLNNNKTINTPMTLPTRKPERLIKSEEDLKKTTEDLETSIVPLNEALDKAKLNFSGLTDNLDDIILGTKDAGDVLKDFGLSIGQDLLGGLFDQMGGKGTGGFGNILGSIAGMAGSFLNPIGGMVGSLFGSIFGKADGGSIGPGRAYMVGERGPELLVTGGMSGSIIPNGRFGGGGAPVNVNVINNSNAKIETRETRNANGGRDIEIMIDEAMARNIRRSGSQSRAALQQSFGASPALALR